jgi:enoyl-CoA hydratase
LLYYSPQIYIKRFVLNKPVIAAVHGFAVAGGLELACWSDMIVSHKEAMFGVYCRRFGVPLIGK